MAMTAENVKAEEGKLLIPCWSVTNASTNVDMELVDTELHAAS
jgi:hypothetical protein